MTEPDSVDKAAKLSTVNPRSETAARSFTFGCAWRRAQHCIVPADSLVADLSSSRQHYLRSGLPD